VLDVRSQRVLGTNGTQLSNQMISGNTMFWSKLRPGLDDHYWRLVMRGTDAYQSRPMNVRVLIEDGFTGLGVQIASVGSHAMRFAPTEPKSTFLVQVSNVSHTVPDTLAILNFMQIVLIGPRYVLMGHNIAAYHQFTNLTWWQRLNLIDRGQRAILDFDDLPLNPVKLATYTGTSSLLSLDGQLCQNFVAFDRCYRQRLSRSVRGMHLCVGGQQLTHRFKNTGRYWRTGR
jgi:hypothetical protein